MAHECDDFFEQCSPIFCAEFATLSLSEFHAGGLWCFGFVILLTCCYSNVRQTVYGECRLIRQCVHNRRMSQTVRMFRGLVIYSGLAHGNKLTRFTTVVYFQVVGQAVALSRRTECCWNRHQRAGRPVGAPANTTHVHLLTYARRVGGKNTHARRQVDAHTTIESCGGRMTHNGLDIMGHSDSAPTWEHRQQSSRPQ